MASPSSRFSNPVYLPSSILRIVHRKVALVFLICRKFSPAMGAQRIPLHRQAASEALHLLVYTRLFFLLSLVATVVPEWTDRIDTIQLRRDHGLTRP